MKKQQTQTRQIKEFLEKGGKITQIGAYAKFRCSRLSARIWDLRHLCNMDVKDQYINANGSTFKEYYL